MLKVGGLFSGIGGFELGLVRAGFEIAWMVEIDSFCQKVLRKHAPVYWPDAEIFGDIHDVGKHNLEPVDLLCGGFPCQPFSDAGNKRGKADDRYLWPEMLRVIRELSPRWIIGENVTGFISMELENALTDLEAEGYQVETFVLPAYGVELPQRRNRIWIMAYPASLGIYEAWNVNSSGIKRIKEKSKGWGRGRCQPGNSGRIFSVPDSDFIRMDNGIPSELDRARIKSLGNAVVPQIVEVLGRMIVQVESELVVT